MDKTEVGFSFEATDEEKRSFARLALRMCEEMFRDVGIDRDETLDLIMREIMRSRNTKGG